MSVLELQQVCKTLSRRKILHDISMRVEEGEVYGFLGPNGAGKTTTIRIIAGLVRASAGQVKIFGHDVQRDRRQALEKVGAIVENPELYMYMTGRQNLRHFAKLAGIAQIDERIDEVTALVKLDGRIDEKVKRYSLGMRQRLGLAQALLNQPKLLILDEPTNGLDPAGMREFRELVRALAKDGMSVFVSSHLLSEIQLMCDRVGILKDGRIITEERLTDLASAEQSMRMRVGQATTAQKILATMGLQSTVEAEHLLTLVVDDAQIPAIVRTLVQHEQDIYALEPIATSLETAFLALTSELDKDTANRGGEANA